MTVSVWLGALDGTEWWSVEPTAVHYAASLMKVPVAVAAERRHQRGEVDLDARVLVHDDLDSVVPGARYVLDRDDDQDDATWDARGTTETLRELRRHSIVVSGNLAVNLVIEHVGLTEVAAVLADAGVSASTVVARGIDDQPARAVGLQNTVTARDLGLLLGHLPAEVEEIMLGQQHRSGIPAGLPDGVQIANKTGWIDGATHDMAVVRPGDGEPFVLVVLRTVDEPYDVANEEIARLAATAWSRRR